MSHQFQKNQKYGYFEVIPKPTDKELEEYYAQKYYQSESANYRHEYSAEERTYFDKKIAQKKSVIDGLLTDQGRHSLLDIGCGEGFTLRYFKQQNWDVLGIDYSDFGIQSMNPELISNFKKGNIWQTLNSLLTEGAQFDVVWLDNVLEHVAEPDQLLEKIQKVCKPNGVLVIEVPNDFSAFQQALVDDGKVTRKYWQAYPDHLVYFSRESLQKLASETGWQPRKILSDFPIEWFLMNEHSNYVNDRTTGKQAHASRIYLENFLDDSVSDKTKLLQFYEALCAIDQGRQLIGFFTKR